MDKEKKLIYVKRVIDNKVVRKPLTENEFKNLPKGEYVEITEIQHKTAIKPRNKNK